jgi:isoleucyl-tRNA synthetase
MVVEDNFKDNATLQEWESNVLLDCSSIKANRRTKRFSRWVRRRLWSRLSRQKELFQIDTPPGDPTISCRYVPDHVALNIFDAMYAIELNLGKLDANKLYNSAKSTSVEEVKQLSESLLSSSTHRSDYQSTLNQSAIDAAYTLGEAVKHTLSLFSPFVPFSVCEKFYTVADEKDAMTFLNLEDWTRYPEKLVMGIFIHLSKISAFLSQRSNKHKMILFSLSSIFSEILFPKEVPFIDQSSDEKMMHSTNVIRLSLILQCIHVMMSTDHAVETEKSSFIGTACSPIHVDYECDSLLRKENAPRPPKEQKIQCRIREYQKLIERAESRIQSAKVTSIKIEQALYNTHVGGNKIQKSF